MGGGRNGRAGRAPPGAPQSKNFIFLGKSNNKYMGSPVQSLGSNVSLMYQHETKRDVARANAAILRARGDAERARYETLATRTEWDNKLRSEKAARKMSSIMEEGSKARGKVIAQRGGSGFTEAGSGSMPEKSVLQKAYDAAQAVAYADSLDDAQLRYRASMLRVSGEIAEMGYDAQAEYYQRQSELYDTMKKGAERTAPWEMVLSGIGAAVGAYFGGPAGAKLGAQAGQATGGIYGMGQLGSAQSMQGMSKDSNEFLGSEMGNLFYDMAKSSGGSGGGKTYQQGAWLMK